MTDWGARAADHLEALAGFSAPGPGVTRMPYGPEHRAAVGYLTGMMEGAGLAVHLDAAATLVGRAEGGGAGTFYMGSHQDSVPEGGAFDGIAGVVLPVLAMQMLSEEGVQLPFAVEVLGFADEEGVRFPTALVGSRAVAGTVDMAVLDMEDRDGVSLRAALEGFGCDPAGIPSIARTGNRALGYLEAHIEQGPVLEAEGEALGVVTGICGIERHTLRFVGETGHAGTVPMAARKDALVGAARVITEVDRLARATPGIRATVGQVDVRPGAVNAVPGEVRLPVELRSEDDAARDEAGAEIQAFARRVADEMGLELEARRTYAQPAAPCDPALRGALVQAVQAGGGRGLELTSGATHDASAMADLCPISMLFIRCRGGVSHRPDENASPADLGAAVHAIAETLRRLADA
ncbi:M20 family metallo-hydrolase [Oceanicola sp. D3]|uniref:M20 family metallo-hydrolase n=1 Tax=Oceanicola sp. D3 TaxID=2587163 RepID=UPI001122B1CB|nr:M20 family metallo-hydrolase [Oceanicola sp. D3]QDC08059.1 M20 family metallo-hydrolase [Oceanicola sp. D3]